jgi:hypothetical protein
MDTHPEAKEFSLSIQTNDIREAIAMTGSALYDLLEQALMTADDEIEEESDFARFTREAFNVLASNGDYLSSDPSSWRETSQSAFRINE